MELEQRPGRETPASRGETDERLPTADSHDADRPAADRPAADRPAADRPAADRPAAAQPAADRPAAGQPAADRPGTGAPAAPDPPASDPPGPEAADAAKGSDKTTKTTKTTKTNKTNKPSKPEKTRGKRGPGRNLPIAIGVGLALGALVLLAVYLVKWVFVGVIAVFIGIAIRELSVALAGRGIKVPFVPVAAGGLAMLIVSYTSGPRGLLAAFSLTVLFVLVWRMPAGSRRYVQDTMAGVLAVVYVPFLAGFAVLLLASEDGADRVITFMAITVGSDIGGFFAGVFLGRHQLVPSISPKKTWEGLAGSAITCMAIGALLLPLLLDGHIWQGLVLGAAVVCSATLGDLIESMIKRDLGIKDMGRLLPEHGGVLDRLDSLLVTAPVVWLGLQIFLPTT
jgi:phosphatidate cytidylyltransferase